MTKTCVMCGVEFEASRSDAKYHSSACKAKAHRLRHGAKEQFRMVNKVTTVQLEDLIAKVESGEFEYANGQALRELAEEIGAPIRDERIREETDKWRKDMDLNRPYSG